MASDLYGLNRMQVDQKIQEHKDQVRDRMSFGGTRDANQIADAHTQGGALREQRQQGLGAAAAQRSAYQNNWGQSDASRFGQNDAARLMQSAAYGHQPSQAQLLGRNMLDQSINSSMAMGASARGGSLAQASAMRNAQNQAGAMQQQGMNNLAALRAQEMAQARGDYFGSQASMRGQDLQQQGMNMQSELYQRGLNQQAQMGYEQMGMGAYQFGDQMAADAMAREQQGQIANAQMESQQWMQGREIGQHQADRRTGLIKDIVGAGVETIGSVFGFGSDERTKQNVRPMGLGQAVGMRGMMMSDERAKQEAFAEGAQFGAGIAHGNKPEPPEYAREQFARVEAPKGNLTEREAEAARKLRREPRYAEVSSGAPATASVLEVQHPQMLPMAPNQRAAVAEIQRPVRPAPAPGLPMPDARAFIRSDVAGKDDVIDLDGVDPGETIDLDRPQFDQRPAREASDPRTASFDRSFKRGTGKADLKAYQDGLGKDADGMIAGMKRSMSGPSSLAEAIARQDRMADANRAMAASEYEYKPEFTPPEQAPGEKNVGPMAQNMAADPVASTAVKKDPATGMLMLDQAKMTKLNSAGIASLQKQVDSLSAALAMRAKGGRK